MKTRQTIKDIGLKVTPQRRIVYEAILQLGHAPMDEIIADVQKKSPDITLSTVYRIIDSFYEAGLITKISHPDGKVWYDITTEEHHHLFDETSSIIDYEDDELTLLVRKHIEQHLPPNQELSKIAIQIFTQSKQ